MNLSVFPPAVKSTAQAAPPTDKNPLSAEADAAGPATGFSNATHSVDLPAETPPAAADDLRESLCNGGEIGPAPLISIPQEMITRLLGVMLDLDGKLLKAAFDGNAAPAPPDMYEQLVRPWLERNDLLRKAEVRDSGSGLHAILWFDPAIELGSDGERMRWAALTKVIQRVLPSDPDAPGITCLTRPVGSLNSKCGRTVTQLAPGQPVKPEEVWNLFEQVCRQPFRLVAGILFGPQTRLEPCPICKAPGTSLAVLDKLGRCYGTCGKVRLADIYDSFLAPRPAARRT